ncbi:MAG TPA: HyaD/HybD family hydrogenase maturation endopeptidase [Vicinamibacterales bacterium]|nr:HyaD/HybD family hydrogenase maturation endopeptidase [Vicinamibacterales bacterium]
MPLLVLGLGNVLLGDDGLGAAAVVRLRDHFIVPPDVHVLDGGTLGLALLPYVEEAEAVILVDAIRGDGPAGTFVRLDGDDVAPAVATRLSPHQVGVSDLLDGARWRDRYPTRVVLLGLVPESIELGVGLSPRVAAALDDLVDRVVDEAAAIGFRCRPKVGHEAAAPDRGLDVARLVGMS